MKAFLASAVLGVLICGCGRANIPPVPLAAPTTPQIPIRPAQFIAQAQAETMPARDQTNGWQFVTVRFHDNTTAAHGLEGLYARGAETNAIIAREITNSPLYQLAKKATNVALSVYAGTFAGFCSREAGSNLVEHFKCTRGVELLSPATLVTSGGGEAVASVTSSATVVTGSKMMGNEPVPTTSILSFGHTVSMRVIGETAGAVRFEASARTEQFGGYARGKDPTKNLLPPRPLFDLTAFGTRAELGRDEVLLIGGPTEVSVRQIIERVPRLSDIPGLGRFFTKVHNETNHFRTVVLISRLPD